MNYYSILNTPVIQIPSGRKMGTVSDILIKENSTEIIGIVATNRSLIYQNRLFKNEDILYCVTEKIAVRGPGTKFLKYPKEPDLISFKELIGLKAAPENSRIYIGTVKDGYFDMEAGVLSELLIGGNIADDIIYGRKILKADSIKNENGILKAKNPSLFQKNRGLKALSTKNKTN